MLANFNDSTILGTLPSGQGSVIAVEGLQAASLNALLADYARGLFLGLRKAFALILKRNAAGTAAMRWCPTPRPAMCWTSCSTLRHQRHPRWLSGVVVDPGTVGVRW